MRREILLLVVITTIILVLDQWTKYWVVTKLSYHEPVEILGQYLRFTYTRNSGVAFGLGAGAPFPYYVFSIIAAVAIVYLFVRSRVRSRLRQIGLSMILGGALGNLVDRLRFGEVVDFIEVGVERWYWPVFNVADSAVTVGVILFALTWAHRHSSAEAGSPGEPGGEPPSQRQVDGTSAGPVGAGAERGGAAGPVSRGGAGGHLT